jgi:hypothetical protein
MCPRAYAEDFTMPCETGWKDRDRLVHISWVASDRTTPIIRKTVEDWTLEALNPNRLTFLAQLARKSSAQALQRAPAARRYPFLVAFLAQCLADVTDEGGVTLG